MFSFFKEFDVADEISGFRYMSFNNQKIYVEGFKSVLSFDEKKVVLKTKDNELTISGVDLKISQLGNCSILINGEIKGVLVD